MAAQRGTPQWIKTAVSTLVGAVVGMIVFVIGDLLFWCGMALLVFIGAAEDLRSDQAETVLMSQMLLSLAVGVPLGAACGALTGAYRSFINEGVESP